MMKSNQKKYANSIFWQQKRIFCSVHLLPPFWKESGNRVKNSSKEWKESHKIESSLSCWFNLWCNFLSFSLLITYLILPSPSFRNGRKEKEIKSKAANPWKGIGIEMMIVMVKEDELLIFFRHLLLFCDRENERKNCSIKLTLWMEIKEIKGEQFIRLIITEAFIRVLILRIELFLFLIRLGEQRKENEMIERKR